MSQYPSNFGQQPGGPSYGAPKYSAPGGSPYSGPGGMQPPPAKKGPNWLLIIGIAVGVLVLGGAAAGVCCCGGGMAAMFPVLTQAVADEVAVQVQDNPVVQEEIGTIESMTYNFSKSMDASADGGEMMAFDVVGDAGSGVIVVEADSAGGSVDITYGRLITSDGEEIDLGY